MERQAPWIRLGWATVMAIAALIVSGGCGEGPTAENPKEAAMSYLKAFAARDAEAVCDKVTSASSRGLVRAAVGRHASCAAALDETFTKVDAPDYATRGEVGEPRIKGNRASVVVTSPDLTTTQQRLILRLVEVDGLWKVELGRGGLVPPS